jgi:PhnB protein
MSVEINHLIVPATDKKASARFLAEVLGIEPGSPMGHFHPVQIGPVTLDYDDASNIRPMHIAFLVDEDTFEKSYQRLLDGGTSTYADPGRSRPGEINHRFGGRGVYFDDPDGHLFELMTSVPDGKETAGADGRVRAVPEGLSTVAPRVVVREGAAAIDFYTRAFGAQEEGGRFTDPSGRVIHAEIRIGDSVVMITEDDQEGPVAAPERVEGLVTCVLSLHWEDVDAAWERAVAAGAEVVFPLADQFYGDRGGRLRDPFGQQWMMSQHIEDVTPEEMHRRAAELFGS